jgi:hypothetical protein
VPNPPHIRRVALRAVACTIMPLLLVLVLVLVPTPALALQRATQSDSSVYRTGVDADGAERYFQLLQDVDADLQRISLRWGYIARGCDGDDHDAESRRDPELAGCYDWELVDQAAAAGPQVIFTVREVPCWLHRDCDVTREGDAFVGRTDEQLARFRDELGSFLAAAAARYPQVTHWTTWNEPNGFHFWSESEHDDDEQPAMRLRACHFAHVHVHAAAAIRDASTADDVKVAFGPLAPSATRQPIAFLEAAAAARTRPGLAELACSEQGEPILTADDVDALALHAYPGTTDLDPFEGCAAWSDTAIIDRRSTSLQCIDEFAAHLDANADGPLAQFDGAPMWVLETAYEDALDDPERGIDALRQARYLSLALERLAGAGAEVVSWYPAVDGGSVEDWQSGFVNAQVRARRPLALAFQAPLAVRRLDDGSWSAWTPSHDRRDGSILVSERCDHASAAPVDARYAFRRVDARELDSGLRATFDELAPGSCLAVGDGDVPLPGLVIGIRRGENGQLEPYAVSARVIEDIRLDPWGDVIVEGDGQRRGNPTGTAILRRLLTGSPEPIRWDPTLPLP